MTEKSERQQLIEQLKYPVLINNYGRRSESWLVYDRKLDDFFLEQLYMDVARKLTLSEALRTYKQRIGIPGNQNRKLSTNSEKKDAILPIHQKWIDLILSGKKTIEVRKIVPSSEIETIYTYACAPVSAIVAKVDVKGIDVINGIPEKLTVQIMENLKKACLTEDEFREYVGRKADKEITFFHIENPVAFYRPIKISARPQSLMYVNERLQMEITNGTVSA